MKYLLILIALLVLFSCEDTSMTFPVLETKGSLEVRVSPYHIERTLSIVDTTNTVLREYRIPAGDSSAIVSQIPLGYYEIHTTAESYLPHSTVTTVSSAFEYTSIFLSTLPLQIEKISPTPGTINSLNPSESSNFTDTMALISIRFNGPVDTTDLKSKINLTPSVEWSLSCTKDMYYDTKCYIHIPLDIFFQIPNLQITLDSSIGFEKQAKFTENYNFSYTIDTTLAEAANNVMHIRRSHPTINQLGFEPTDTCYITFNKEVDKISVEKALSVTPAVTPSFWWGYKSGYNTLYFTFTKGLQAQSAYTIKIDTTMQFLDGSSLSSPLEIPFQTVDFYLKGTSPANGEIIEDYYYQDIEFHFSVHIDSASFMNAYSLSPAESHTSVTYTGSSIKVIYSWELDNNTEYTITVDSTLTDIYGTPYGREIQTMFRVTD